jgi:hypothetical protein
MKSFNQWSLSMLWASGFSSSLLFCKFATLSQTGNVTHQIVEYGYAARIFSHPVMA